MRTILVPRTRSPLALTRLGPIRSGVRSVVAALVASIVMLLGAVVHAQTLEFAAVLGATAAANAQGAPASDGGVAGRFTVSLAGARVNGTTVGASLGYSLGTVPGAWPRAQGVPVGDAAQLGLSLAGNQTFGPLGNVIFELSGALRTDALGQATLAVRGTIGPLAARVRLVAFGADAAVFDVLALAGDERPTLGLAGAGAQVGVTARFGRDVIVDVEPELYFTSAGFTGRLDSRLRLLRAIGANELRVYLEGATVRRRPDFGPQAWPDFGPDIAPGAGHESDPMSWHVAVGAGVLLPRGRAPDVELVALVGTRGSGVSPGARVSWAESLVGGLRVDATAGFEPFRVDVHPLRLAVGLELPVATGRTLRFDAVAATLDPSRPTAFALRSSLRLPIDLR